jgi:hypothetical protein
MAQKNKEFFKKWRKEIDSIKSWSTIVLLIILGVLFGGLVVGFLESEITNMIASALMLMMTVVVSIMFVLLILFNIFGPLINIIREKQDVSYPLLPWENKYIVGIVVLTSILLVLYQVFSL